MNKSLKLAAALSMLAGTNVNAKSVTVQQLEVAQARATSSRGVFEVDAAKLYEISSAANYDGLGINVVGPSNEIGKILIEISKGSKDLKSVKGLSAETQKEMQMAGDLMMN